MTKTFPIQATCRRKLTTLNSEAEVEASSQLDVVVACHLFTCPNTYPRSLHSPSEEHGMLRTYPSQRPSSANANQE
jgi:hypothetical protein